MNRSRMAKLALLVLATIVLLGNYHIISYFLHVIKEISTLNVTCKVLIINGSKDLESGIATISTPGNLRFYACTRCKIYRYCGKVGGSLYELLSDICSHLQDCQKEAWENHHKYECKTLKKMGKWETSEEDKLVHMARIRIMVRLLELQLENKIPESEWKEIQSLAKNETLNKHNEFYEGAKMSAKGLRHFTVTDLSEAEILSMQLAVSRFRVHLTHYGG
jgi:hypothetical protein